MGLFDALFQRRTDRLINAAVREALAVAETEKNFLHGTRSLTQTDRDRYTYELTEVLEQSLAAWRVNPLARRIVELTSQYVVGGGLSITCKSDPESQFLDKFWNHRLNRMSTRVSEMCDELTRTGNLFVIITTDTAGMSYIRLMPASHIEKIISAENDIEQPVWFHPKAGLENLDPEAIPAYNPAEDDGKKPVIIHYAVNRPAGAQWGEPDLAPLLVWLSRYSNWLQDRVRLNRFRNAFMFVVQAKFASEAQRKARQTALNASPPKPGSILVSDENETWKVISPRLDSGDAEKDGLAIKKMISAGAGIPLHFLAEPESATRTTADAAGGPTFRRFEQRQEYFLWMINDILRVVLSRRAMVDRKLDPNTELAVTGADISSRDNNTLSQAAYYMIEVLANLKDRNLIANEEFLRLIYRFFGESVDAQEMLAKAKGEIDITQGRDSNPRSKDGNPSKKIISPPDDGFKDKK